MHLIRVEDGQAVRRIEGGEQVQRAIVFHPQRFEVALQRGTDVVVVDLESGSEQLFPGHRMPASELAYSDDGGLLVSVSGDLTLRTWDLKAGLPLWRTSAFFVEDESVSVLTHRGWARDQAPWNPPTDAWRGAVSRAWDSSARGDSVCVLGAEGDVELWSRSRDVLQVRVPMAGLGGRVEATDHGCVVSREGAVHHVSSSSKTQPIAEGDALLGVGRDGVWVLSQGRLWHVGEGVEARPLPFALPAEPLALAESPSGLMVLDRDGGLVGEGMAAITLENMPRSPPLRLQPGPGRAVFVGFADGTLGLWSLESGKRMDTIRLHGPIRHTLLADAALWIATELGDVAHWNVSTLDEPYCALMNEVWQHAPVVWRSGRVEKAGPPLEHTCAHPTDTVNP